MPLLLQASFNYFVFYKFEQRRPWAVHDLLVQKANGNFYLMVWDENPAGQDTFTVNLGGMYTNIVLYNPTLGTSVYDNVGTASNVTLTESNHPIIIELPPNPLTVQPTPPPIPVP